ncbi:hypothetical protein PAESOLCIP111_02126 [Paenibacillus solanacearum]|uniref:Endo-alpha-N-acetylgalactosaminidase domain-containing protein n=1 Tax=Paenibacillus solanacearum TaxID=2048548 RepID=A0A916K344_9BACL|nr:endo-alpha-N-acetylgalactosaminidase family protein [Paenibacillus solanacearum]CAG7618557.1 hypothetical protein PAESOLCIP111_02126 [Paenibacillus solanacearum]
MLSFQHRYHQTLTMKMTMCEKGGQLRLTCEQALEVIRRLDRLTRGIPKIIYLVGWQYDGHDTGYPAMDVVNPRIRREEDATALDSLKWLMSEAFQYRTAVSLHINMLDAQEDSPMWDEYVNRDLLARNPDGSLRKYKWGYPISYTREWSAGFAQRRIDRLTDMLPLARAGTIHIDAFHQYIPGFGEEAISPYHGITTDEEIETQRSIIRYWMDKGVDVTSEFDGRYRKDPLIGLQPFAWHFGQLDPMQVPASVYVGGEGGDARFGVSMLGQGLIKKDPEKLKGFLQQFCTTALPWYFLNRLERLQDKDGEVTFSNGVTSGKEGDRLWIRQAGRWLRRGGDVFVPALWLERSHPEMIAFSEEGYSGLEWELPPDWPEEGAVEAYRIGIDGLTPFGPPIPVRQRTVTLTLGKGEAFSIVPQGVKP